MPRRGGFEYFTGGEWGRVGFLGVGKVKAGRVDVGKRRRVGEWVLNIGSPRPGSTMS